MVASDGLLFYPMRPLTRARLNSKLFFFFGHLRQTQIYSFGSIPHLLDMVDLTLVAHFIHNHNRDNLRHTNIDEDKTNVLESIKKKKETKKNKTKKNKWKW